LFVAAAEKPESARVLVRAERTRRMTRDHGSLWTFMGRQPLADTEQLKVPRRGRQPTRQARMELRFASVELKPPKRKRELPGVQLWAVWTREVDPPAGVKPLEWMLLSSVAVDTLEQARERLAWYAARWQIEVYHRTLKSGCRIEERQLGSATRLEACLAIDLVVAWRIFHLAKLGREIPDVPCTVFFEDAEWKALVVRVKQTRNLPASPPSLREALRMVASLGGFLGRKADGEPGTQSLWLGLQRLDDITAMYCLVTINLTGRRQLSWPLFEAKVAGIFATRRHANVGQTHHHTTGQVIHEQQKANADTGAGQRQGGHLRAQRPAD
jgi:hypothetical protein